MLQTVKSSIKFLVSMPVVLALLYVGSVVYNHERVIPRGVETIQDFYARYGNPPAVESFFINSRVYYRVIGEIAAPLAFPRGNPVYVFDATGRLVDWTAESDGDPDFRARWSDSPAQNMAVSYFLERFPRD